MTSFLRGFVLKRAVGPIGGVLMLHRVGWTLFSLVLALPLGSTTSRLFM